MDSRLGELTQQGYNALQDEREKAEQERQEQIAQAHAEADEAWAEVEEYARELLPECLYPYVRRPTEKRPWEKPGAWAKLRIEVPELVPIIMALKPDRTLSAYQVPTHVYIDRQGSRPYTAHISFSSSKNFEDLTRALGKAFEMSQRLLAKEVEAQEQNRNFEQYQEQQIAAEEARYAAKKAEPDSLEIAKKERSIVDVEIAIAEELRRIAGAVEARM